MLPLLRSLQSQVTCRDKARSGKWRFCGGQCCGEKIASVKDIVTFNTLTITNKPRWRKITGHAIYHIATKGPRSKLALRPNR